jgi:hypothetical protein
LLKIGDLESAVKAQAVTPLELELETIKTQAVKITLWAKIPKTVACFNRSFPNPLQTLVSCSVDIFFLSFIFLLDPCLFCMESEPESNDLHIEIYYNKRAKGFFLKLTSVSADAFMPGDDKEHCGGGGGGGGGGDFLQYVS